MILIAPNCLPAWEVVTSINCARKKSIGFGRISSQGDRLLSEALTTYINQIPMYVIVSFM